MNPLEKPSRPEVIKYGDLFSVEGELASKPITPQDAAAEKDALGDIPPAAISSVMKSVADLNERRGLVAHDDAVKDVGPRITETTIAGHRVVAESIAGQLLGRFAHPMDGKLKRVMENQRDLIPIN